MSSPDPRREYGENEHKQEFKKKAKSKALSHAKSGGLIGKLKSQIAESEKARSGNWRDLLGKK